MFKKIYILVILYLQEVGLFNENVVIADGFELQTDTINSNGFNYGFCKCIR